MRFGDAELDPQSPFKACSGCGKRMSEAAARRCIGEKMAISVMPEEEGMDGAGNAVVAASAADSKTTATSSLSSFRQSIRVVIRESFCLCAFEDLRLGQVVEIVGFASKTIKIWRDVGLHVEAVGVIVGGRQNKNGVGSAHGEQCD